jgi:hypothetical protein
MLHFTKTEFAHPSMSIEDIVGNIRYFASESHKDKLSEQFDKAYSFGGGWRPFPGFTMDKDDGTITYPEDPPFKPLAVSKFREQTVYVYNYGWVAIVEPDGSFEISRMD